MFVEYLALPFCTLAVCADDRAISAVRRVERAGEDRPNALTGRACAAIRAYFDGAPLPELPLAPAGTAFEQAVWQALREIPYGQTRCYQQIAEAIGKPKAVRAVGRAIGKNPILFFLPCHRVIGKDGGLTGFSAGLELKERLLRLERREREDA